MNDIEPLRKAIPERHSVRNYDGCSISPEFRQNLESYISAIPGIPLQSVVPHNFKLKLCSLDNSQPVKLGSYGVIKGARQFITLIVPRDTSPLGLVSGAFSMQWLSLWLLTEGYGSCWMSGTVNRSSIFKQLDMDPSENMIPAVLPFGHPSKGFSLLNSIMRSAVKSGSRKDFDKLFDTPPGTSEEITSALEAVRLAPSACNRQPWRANVDPSGKEVTFFYDSEPSVNNRLDMGIALCHFYISMGAKGLFTADGDSFIWSPDK